MSTAAATLEEKKVTHLRPDNMAAIQYMFRRACHAVSARSPVEMSDPAAVSRLLGEVFADMQHEEARWLAEIKGAKGWVCDLPAKLGGGTVSYTVVNATTSRLQVAGNQRWNTKSAVELSDDADRAELESALLRFAQDGVLLELPAPSQQQQQHPQSTTADALPAGSTRITIMKDNKDQMRVFLVKDASESRKIVAKVLSLIQQWHMKASAGADKMMVAVVAF